MPSDKKILMDDVFKIMKGYPSYQKKPANEDVFTFELKKYSNNNRIIYNFKAVKFSFEGEGSAFVYIPTKGKYSGKERIAFVFDSIDERFYKEYKEILKQCYNTATSNLTNKEKTKPLVQEIGKGFDNFTSTR